MYYNCVTYVIQKFDEKIKNNFNISNKKFIFVIQIMSKFSKTISIRLDKNLDYILNQICNKLDCTPSEAIRYLIENYKIPKKNIYRYQEFDEENVNSNSIEDSENSNDIQKKVKLGILQNMEKLQKLRNLKIRKNK